MIITKLKGGLANQIFQWAYGKYLSEKYNTPLYLDLSFYQNQYGVIKRDFSLNKFSNLSYNILPNEMTKFTYWLDGHYSNGDTGKGSKDFPIMMELESILKRNITSEIIYIDDMRILRNLDDDVNLNSIINLIEKYKTNYKISYEDSSLHNGEYLYNDIMIIEY